MTHVLRPYQQAAVEAIFEDWKEHDSTLVVMPTGTGKTQVFSEVIKRTHPGRCMVLAHRGELIYQAAKRIEAFGITTSIEMADLTSSVTFWNKTPVVVSTIQTQIAGTNGSRRFHKFDPFDFDVLIVDEAHHATSPSYLEVINHYRKNPKLRLLGVTATPDRTDEQALGQVFKSVAYDYEILDAINDGYLVPIEQQIVEIEGLDFSTARTTAGDLNGADLAAIMEQEKTLHGIASASLEIIGQKRTLVFTASVKQAEMLAEIYNRHRPGMAAWVCGMTPKDERAAMLRDYEQGRIQTVVNCGVLTEGFDNPGVEIVIQARPTKSRCLYSQMVGRATRPLPGVVDGHDVDDPQVRKDAIAASAKPVCLVVDFVGNSGRHKLMTSADILGGKVSDEAIERAVAKAKAEGRAVRMDVELEQAEDELRKEIEEAKQREAARKAALIGKAKFSVRRVNPFDILDIQPERARGWDSGKQLSEKQRALLLRQGIDPSDMPYNQSKQLLNEMFRRWNGKLATMKQCALLKKHGVETHDLTMDRASKMITQLANNHWQKPQEWAA